MNPDSIKVEFIRFDHDVQGYPPRAIEGSPLPHEFADMLRKALRVYFVTLKSAKRSTCKSFTSCPNTGPP